MADEPKLTKFENFEIIQINRDEINFSYYNPRKISDENRKKLKKKIQKIGLIQPVIFNNKTKNLISGHQRLKILDQLHKNCNYKLTVAQVDLEEKEEIEMNIFLNNQSAMGEWDIIKLGGIKEEIPELDFVEDLGFDLIDLEFFEHNEDVDLNLSNNIETKQISYDIDKINQQKKDYKQKVKQMDKDEQGEQWVENNDYIISFVFNNNKDKHEFMNKISQPIQEKYLKYTILFDLANNKYNLF